MLQQLSHVRNGQAKKDEGLKQKQNNMYVYIYIYLCYVYVQQYRWGTESCTSWHSKYSYGNLSSLTFPIGGVHSVDSVK